MLDDTFSKIDKIINEIENLNSANDFEESIKLYKEGIEIINLCKKYIKEISLKKDIENQNKNEINLNTTINKMVMAAIKNRFRLYVIVPKLFLTFFA